MGSTACPTRPASASPAVLLPAPRAAEIDWATLRLAADRPGEDPEIAPGEAGAPVEGPAVIPMEGATCWVGEGWTARTDARGVIVMERVN